MSMTDDQRMEARAWLMKSRLYRLFAMIFAGGGLLVFIAMSARYMGEGLIDILRDPRIIAVILIPFLPAAVMARMSESAHKKFRKIAGAAGQVDAGS